MKTRVFLIVVALWAVSGLAALEVPPLSAPVTDLAGLLTSDQTERLNTLLLDFEQETSNQFALLIIPSLDGEDLESFSLEVAETWRLGQAGKDNGLLLLVALSERRLRIEVGYGLEGVLTDLFCGRVIDNTIVPYFKSENYYEGLVAGLAELIEQTGDEFSAELLDEQAQVSEFGFQTGAYLFLTLPLLMMIPIAIFLGRSRAFKKLFKKKFASMSPQQIRAAAMNEKLYRVWKKRTASSLKARVVGLSIAGVIPMFPALVMTRVAPFALLIPGLYLFCQFIVPLIYRPRELPRSLSYSKLEGEFRKLKSLMAEVSSVKERREMLKLFFAGYVSLALMRMVIRQKGHFDRSFFMQSYRSSSSGGSGSSSSFSGGGGSFGGGGASGSW